MLPFFLVASFNKLYYYMSYAKKRVGNLSHLTPMTSLQNHIAVPIA